MPQTYVVHYSEVALKGKNRPLFTKVLRQNISRALRDLGRVEIEHLDGRFVLQTEAGERDVAHRLSRVFGVAWFARATVVEREFNSIRSAVLVASESIAPGGTFRISARRADKSFPLGSIAMAAELGSAVIQKTGAGVDLKGPDVTIHVDVLSGRALVYAQRQSGPGGLPVGVGGRVIHLFSGGIDSPVAAWLLMKRGCKPVHLHFYLAPSPEDVLTSKILGLIRTLSEGSGRSTIVLIPFAEYQVATAGVAWDCEPSLFRRFMRVTAQTLAPHFGAQAISTGDSLAQAASQTIWNLRVFDDGSPLPILRPLLTYDKQEITELAKKIGTYELSIQEYKDCCAIITRHPRTRAKLEIIVKYADALDFPSLVQKCISLGTLVTYNPATKETKAAPLRLDSIRTQPILQREG